MMDPNETPAWLRPGSVQQHPAKGDPDPVGKMISAAQAQAAAPAFLLSAFDRLLEETQAAVVKLSTLKGGEYAGDVDRLANFRRNGRDCDLPMEVIWRVYAGKHWDAVTQYVVDVKNGKQRERLEHVDGRIDDLILYLILFKAMVREREQNAQAG